MRIAITGAAGRIGSALVTDLAARGHALVAIDRVPLEGGVVADLTDDAAIPMLRETFADADLVVHLAGIPSEAPWHDMVAANVTGTRTALEAARLAGVRRVLLASSIHAVGMLTAAETRDVAEPAPHPDTYYGAAKAADEALGRLYADRFGMTVVAARIGTATPEPHEARSLHTWLSAADRVRLVEAVGTTEATGGHVVWAVSRNTRRWVSHAAGEAIGFDPQDDAETFAAALGHPEPLPDTTRLGGVFTLDGNEVGGRW